MAYFVETFCSFANAANVAVACDSRRPWSSPLARVTAVAAAGAVRCHREHTSSKRHNDTQLFARGSTLIQMHPLDLIEHFYNAANSFRGNCHLNGGDTLTKERLIVPYKRCHRSAPENLLD